MHLIVVAAIVAVVAGPMAVHQGSNFGTWKQVAAVELAFESIMVGSCLVHQRDSAAEATTVAAITGLEVAA